MCDYRTSPACENYIKYPVSGTSVYVGMATLPSTPQEQKHQQKPKLPLLHLKSYSTDPDGNSPPRSTTRNNVSWAENSYVLQLDDTQQDDITPTHYTLPAPFIFKLMQMITSVVCIGLYSEGLNRIPNNITTQLFPYIVCSIYLIITPVIAFSYVTGHRMPELIVRIFNTLAGILFLVAGVVALDGYSFYLVTYKLQLDNYSTRDDIETHDDEDSSKTLDRQGAFLLASGILCIINSLFYFLDIGWSVYTTLSSL
ncbi:uncharacterized protein LOC110838271 [Zootermopsis nevadensis]|uniref:DUF7775 domain-containing protein n=1 Tax=Zootermopsis nevadensis TaxID=136037 RepID=A0A067QLQ2_ZOONE|nr:uncharacterized protein LOC110838271 [Zootermopsis nevadensis]KDR10072.1 hypothetical protein L798_15309 [Zootermopsis nevadensis]